MLYTIRNITEERLLALKYELLDQWTMVPGGGGG